MVRILYGFSIGDRSHEPVFFYHHQSAENYARAHGLDWIIGKISEDEVDLTDILDTEDSIWTP